MQCSTRSDEIERESGQKATKHVELIKEAKKSAPKKQEEKKKLASNECQVKQLIVLYIDD